MWSICIPKAHPTVRYRPDCCCWRHCMAQSELCSVYSAHHSTHLLPTARHLGFRPRIPVFVPSRIYVLPRPRRAAAIILIHRENSVPQRNVEGAVRMQIDHITVPMHPNSYLSRFASSNKRSCPNWVDQSIQICSEALIEPCLSFAHRLAAKCGYIIPR
jgi:hypothetical protein